MIELKNITWNNFWDVLSISPKDDQRHYVKPISVFMAQSYINLKEGYKDISLAIYYDSILIGYTKLVYVPKNIEPYYLKETACMIDALIIDQAHQGKGYGKVVLSDIIDYCIKFFASSVKHIVLTCHVDNLRAQKLFKSFLFREIKQTSKSKNMLLYSKKI